MGRTSKGANRLLDLKPAPGELRLVQEFLNTVDLEAKTDELTGPRALADWLVSRGLMPEKGELETVDVQRAVAFRESLRALLAAGAKASREHGAAVDRAASEAHLRARFEAGGELRFVPVASGLDGAFGRLLASIAAAQRHGLWTRFRVCVICHAAFYDGSTNRTGLYCLRRCGGRMRMRDHRRRKKHAGLKV